MARSTTIRLPGSVGPDVLVERRAFSRPRVSIAGKEILPTPGSKDTYSVVTPDGTARSFALKSDRTGLSIVADDGSRLALDPPRPLWETALAFLPLGLVAVGGLVGGVFGGVAAAGNLAISRSDLRTPVRVAAMVALSAAAAVTWLIIAVTIAVTVSPLPTFAAGQCVNGIGTGDAIDAAEIRTTECASPHRGEVVGIHVLTVASDGAAFPGLATIETTAADRCPPLFEAFVGIPYDASRLEMIYLYPSEDTWRRGDRQIACIAIGATGQELTGTVAGTAQ